MGKNMRPYPVLKAAKLQNERVGQKQYDFDSISKIKNRYSEGKSVIIKVV